MMAVRISCWLCPEVTSLDRSLGGAGGIITGEIWALADLGFIVLSLLFATVADVNKDTSSSCRLETSTAGGPTEVVCAGAAT